MLECIEVWDRQRSGARSGPSTDQAPLRRNEAAGDLATKCPVRRAATTPRNRAIGDFEGEARFAGPPHEASGIRTTGSALRLLEVSSRDSAQATEAPHHRRRRLGAGA